MNQLIMQSYDNAKKLILKALKISSNIFFNLKQIEKINLDCDYWAYSFIADFFFKHLF